MEAELNHIASGTDFGRVRPLQVDIWGPGLGRGLEWINRAMELNCSIEIRDLSLVACENVTSYADLFTGRIGVWQEEIESAWNADEMSTKSIVVASQLIQVQKQRKARRLLRLLGSWLKPRPDFVVPRVYLVHPLPEDNNQPTQWRGQALPDVEWGDTTPYSSSELTGEMEKGLKGNVHLEILGKHHYFHQTYSFLKFTAAP